MGDGIPVTVLPYLYLGDRKTARNLELLQELKIRYILNMTPHIKDRGVPNFFEMSEHQFHYLRLPLRDVKEENLQKYLPQAFQFMENALARKDGNILVHCNEGKSRSVSVATAYLMQTQGMTLKAALAKIEDQRPEVDPCRFMDDLELFESQLEKSKERSQKSKRKRLEAEEGAPAAAPVEEASLFSNDGSFMDNFLKQAGGAGGAMPAPKQAPKQARVPLKPPSTISAGPPSPASSAPAQDTGRIGPATPPARSGAKPTTPSSKPAQAAVVDPRTQAGQLEMLQAEAHALKARLAQKDLKIKQLQGEMNTMVSTAAS